MCPRQTGDPMIAGGPVQAARGPEVRPTEPRCAPATTPSHASCHGLYSGSAEALVAVRRILDARPAPIFRSAYVDAAPGVGRKPSPTGQKERPRSMHRTNLIIRSEQREGVAPRHARKMESQHALARRQLAASRLAARDIERPPPTGTAAAETPVVVERTALRSAQADTGGGWPSLEALLSPFTVEEFFTAQETRARPVLLRGEAERFSELVRWPDLDALLATGKLDATSVRMVTEGTQVAPGAHAATRSATGEPPGRAEGAGRVDGRKLHALAAEGATLVIDRAHRRLDGALERPRVAAVSAAPPRAGTRGSHGGRKDGAAHRQRLDAHAADIRAGSDRCADGQ